MIFCRLKNRFDYISSLRALRSPLVSLAARKRYSTSTACLRSCEYVCDVDAEPLHRYKHGGFHPVHLGDLLKDGRYRIVHKIGWGSYSTVWAARDQKTHTYVAIKILVAEQESQDQELTALRLIRESRSDQAGHQHLLMMLDFFQVDGPNGTHDCLVLEMLGPNIADIIEARGIGFRYPAPIVKRMVKQTLLGLCSLHENGMTHGDIYTRNVAFTIPSIRSFREQDFLQKFGAVTKSMVRRADGACLDLEPSMPRYLVMPGAYTHDHLTPFGTVKIIDFGQCFLSHNPPAHLHNPISVRPPEVVFGDALDCPMDIWSIGCMLFEVLTGQLLFDSILQTPSGIVAQMLESTGETLPHRWEQAWRTMRIEHEAKRDGWRATLPPPGQEEHTYTLQEWLHQMYFETEQNVDMSKEDINQVGALLQRMMRLEPAARPSARELLQDPWFPKDQ